MLKLLLFSFFISLAVAAHYPYLIEDHIINLGEATWDAAVDEYTDGLFVFFYEPQSSLCKETWPALKQIAAELYDISRAQIARLNCHDEPEFCASKGVRTFPVLMLVRKGKGNFEYRGLRTADVMKTWLLRVIDQLYPKVDYKKELFKRFSVAILVENRADIIFETYKDAFDDVEIVRPHGFEVGGMTEALVAGVLVTHIGTHIRIELKDPPEVLRGHIRRYLFEEKIEVPTFAAWSWAIWQGTQDFIFVMFFRTESYDYNTDAVKDYDEASRERRGYKDEQFLYVNIIGDSAGTTIGDMFGIRPEDNPTIGIASRKDGVLSKYRFNDDKITLPTIRKFVSDFVEGTLPKYYQSAAVAPKNKGDIQEVTANSLYQLIEEGNKSIFVMFYFPWCDWCERLDPTWETLASRFRNNPHLTIARIDMSKNELKGLDVKEFPYLLLYKPKQSQPVEYLKDKTMNKLMKFLEENVPQVKGVFEL